MISPRVNAPANTLRRQMSQKDFYKVRAVRIVIDHQNPSFFFGC